MTLRLRSRRMFLLGASGATLSVPFLASLFRSGAKAQAERPRCFVSFRTGHGGVHPDRFQPGDATESHALGRLSWQMKHSALTREVSGGRARISDVASAPEGLLTERIASSMNIFAGLDYSINTGHNRCSHLGGYCAGNVNIPEHSWGPTIDQLIAHSPSFYAQEPIGSTTRPSVPVPVMSLTANIAHIRPEDPSSGLRLDGGDRDAAGMWRRLFGQALYTPSRRLSEGEDAAEAIAYRARAFNDAYASYSRLTSAASTPGRRLSRLDRQRLERHLDAFDALRSRFEAGQQCDTGDFEPLPRDEKTVDQEVAEIATMTRMAIECGLSRVFNFPASYWTLIPNAERWGGWVDGSLSGPDLHNTVIHYAASALANVQRSAGVDEVAAQALIDNARADYDAGYARQFERVVLPVVRALDFEIDGVNVLDESLVMWSAESGLDTHQSVSVPVMTFGGGGGAFQTGRFLDYRSDEEYLAIQSRPDAMKRHWRKGIAYDQFLGSVLRGFGVELEQFDRYRARSRANRYDGVVQGAPRIGGYGAYSFEQSEQELDDSERPYFHHDDAVRTFADEPLPFFDAS